MADGTHDQVGVTTPQLNAIVQAAADSEADSALLRTEKNSADPATIEVSLFSQEAEGIVGMIAVSPAGDTTELG